MAQSTESMSASIRAAARAFEQRNMLWPPEMIQMPCDLHMQWAAKWLEDNHDYTTGLLKNATDADFDALLQRVFTDDIWPANRRAFFGELHKAAVQYEVDGGAVSEALARFYRARYNPGHRFACER